MRDKEKRSVDETSIIC